MAPLHPIRSHNEPAFNIQYAGMCTCLLVCLLCLLFVVCCLSCVLLVCLLLVCLLFVVCVCRVALFVCAVGLLQVPSSHPS